MIRLVLIMIVFLTVSCNTVPLNSIEQDPTAYLDSLETITLSTDFKDYWYAGAAEISSYELLQSRYGEMRDGKAVLVFVTEPFDINDQVKADKPSDYNRPVMKLNATRDFNTGIYPYSIMSSTFLPVDKKENALKIASSIQEWCGHTYMQFNKQNNDYNIQLHSYFQSEGNTSQAIESVMTENQIALQLRLNPREMPLGSMKMIPSAEFLRLKHVETKAYNVTAAMREMEDGLVYSVRFSELDRTIAYKVEKKFPYRILSWMDRYMDGGTHKVSTGTLIETIKTPYWSQNSNKDEVLRDNLGL